MEYNVKRLPHGYLVSEDGTQVAAFSNFEDMVMWLNERFDIDETWDKAPDGWIEWKGGPPPAIAEGTPIIVRHRDLTEHGTTMLGTFALPVHWQRDESPYDIVAYKVVDGWIDWKGGPRPVKADTKVAVKMFGTEAVSKQHTAGVWDWTWRGIDEPRAGDIVAYKVCN